jgi:cation transport regulator ChaC
LRTYLFGYGSLINRQSFERALKRALSAAEFRAAVVKDYRRCWRAKETLHFEQLDSFPGPARGDIKDPGYGW